MKALEQELVDEFNETHNAEIEDGQELLDELESDNKENDVFKIINKEKLIELKSIL